VPAFVESLKTSDPKNKGKKKLLNAETRGIQAESIGDNSSSPNTRRLERVSTLVLQSSHVTAGTIDSLVDHLTDVYSVAGKLISAFDKPHLLNNI
jgi:hypothetical protein